MIPKISSDWIKQQIDSVRDNIGRNVTFYTVDKSACSLCVTNSLYDPVSDTSFNILCPICAGSYWIEAAVGTEVLARVHWANDEAVQATPAGKYYIGDATLTVDPENLSLAEQCQSESGAVLVDGHMMQIIKIIPFGAPVINRYRIILKNMGDRPS